MTKRFTSAGAMLAMRAVTGNYHLALGRGQDTNGLLEEAAVGGYARRPVTIIARRAIGTNAAAVTFGTFATNASACTHAGLYTADAGGTCIWVGPLETALDIAAGGSVTIAPGALSLRVELVETTTAVVVAPANTTPPAISGTARVGEQLTASTGTWSGTAPITYAVQWQRGTSAIAGATSATYAVQAADLGQVLRAVITASNGAGSAQASAAPTAPVAAALVAPANTTPPAISGTAQVGEQLIASTGTWSGTAPITYAVQWQRGGTPIGGATAASYTVQAADVGQTLRVVVTATNGAGTTGATSASTAPVVAAPLPGITVATPAGAFAPSSDVPASGSYSGAMASASLVWEQNGNAVGQPIAITSFSAGAWTATIPAPGTGGIYRLRATFNGTGPAATSDDVTIGTSDPMNLANFTFDGSGDGADTVVVFGHSFPAGALPPMASVVLRRSDNNAPLRTQMTRLTAWPDGSVKTAAFAGELPALANGALLPVRLRRDEAHPSPGTALTWAGALAGRSVRIRTWAPGNTTTPLWSYDVGAALLTSTDDWMTTAGTQPGPPTVRLIVDVTATKDGMLLADWAFCNDRVHVAGGATARFGYTVEIDGVIVHDSRPATGPGRDLFQYSWWWRRRAKKDAKVYNFGTVFRPLFRPDYQALVDSKYLLPFATDLVTAEWLPTIGSTTAAAVPTSSADPLWAASVIRDQGAAGGRPEIGYKTAHQFAWIVQNVTQPRRFAELEAHINGECFAISSNFLRDYEFDRPLMADEWPRFATFFGERSPTILPRNLADYFIDGQHRPSDPTNRIQSGEDQHRGAHYGATALLSGRRLMYDALSFRVSDALWDSRFNGISLANTGGSWKSNAPDHTTGRAWAPPFWRAGNGRGLGWALRDFVEAAYLIPSSYQRADYYRKHVQAYLNMFINSQPLLDAAYGGYFGLQIGTDGRGSRVINWMNSFFIYAIIAAHRMGIDPAATAVLIDRLVDYRATPVGTSEEHARVRTVVNDFNWAVHPASPPFPAKNWDDTLLYTTVPAADWSTGVGEGDWQRNIFNSNMMLAAYAQTPERKALARDALVRFRSFRKVANGAPRVHPEDFVSPPNAMTNLLRPEAFGHNWDTAPVLAPPAVMTVAASAAAGTLIGLVDWMGAIPRCTVDSNASHDAFQIVSQPAGNPFTVSRGGAIRRSATGTLTPGQTTLQVRARTISGHATVGQTEVTRWSNTVTVTVTVV